MNESLAAMLVHFGTITRRYDILSVNIQNPPFQNQESPSRKFFALFCLLLTNLHDLHSLRDREPSIVLVFCFPNDEVVLYMNRGSLRGHRSWILYIYTWILMFSPSNQLIIVFPGKIDRRLHPPIVNNLLWSEDVSKIQNSCFQRYWLLRFCSQNKKNTKNALKRISKKRIIGNQSSIEPFFNQLQNTPCTYITVYWAIIFDQNFQKLVESRKFLSRTT